MSELPLLAEFAGLGSKCPNVNVSMSKDLMPQINQFIVQFTQVGG